MKYKHEKPRSKRKFIIMLSVSFLLVFAISATVLAAFIGKGNKKGVLLTSKYYFSSNLLSQFNVSSDRDLQKAKDSISRCRVNTNGTSTLSFNVRNYNSESEFDNFDISFKLYFWLNSVPADDNLYDYYAVIDGKSQKIEKTAPGEGVVCELTGDGKAAEKTYSVNFVRKDNTVSDDFSKAVGICVAAVPISPAYMTTFGLGTTIFLSESNQEFSITSKGFDSELNDSALGGGQTDSLKDLAAFIYRFTTSGVIEEGKSVIIILTWDASKLEFDKTNNLLNSGYVEGTENSDGTRWDSVSIKLDGTSASMDAIYQITFYRASGAQEFWKNATVNDVESLVDVN